MMKKGLWITTLAVLLAAGAGAGAVLLAHPAQSSQLAHSPLEKEGRMEGMLTQWQPGHALLLPSYMPKYFYLRDAKITPADGKQQAYGYLIDTDRVLIRTAETSRHDLHELPAALNHQTLQEVNHALYDQMIGPPLFFEGNTILQSLVPVKLIKGTGYWLHFHNTAYGGSEYKVFTFIQDGVQFELSGPLENEEMQRVANSFVRVR